MVVDDESLLQTMFSFFFSLLSVELASDSSPKFAFDQAIYMLG